VGVGKRKMRRRRRRTRKKGGEKTQPQVKWILASVCTKLAITACNMYKIR